MSFIHAVDSKIDLDHFVQKLRIVWTAEGRADPIQKCHRNAFLYNWSMYWFRCICRCICRFAKRQSNPIFLARITSFPFSSSQQADNTKWALKTPKYKNGNLLNEIEVVNYLVTKALETVNTNSTKDISLAYHLIYFENVGLCGRCQMSIVQMPLLGMSLKCLKSQLMNRSPLHPYLPSLTVYFWTIQMVSENQAFASLDDQVELILLGPRNRWWR